MSTLAISVAIAAVLLLLALAAGVRITGKRSQDARIREAARRERHPAGSKALGQHYPAPGGAEDISVEDQ